MTINWQDLDKEAKGALIRPYIEDQMLSYSQVAAIIGVSRVAIAGAADRNNISSPYSRGARPNTPGSKGGTATRARLKGSIAAARRNAPGKIPTAPQRPNKFVATYIPEDVIDRRPPKPGAWLALPGTDPKPLGDHKAGQCIWPIGSDDEPFRFCCAPLDPKGTYCPTHRAMAFKPTPALKLKGRKT